MSEMVISSSTDNGGGFIISLFLDNMELFNYKHLNKCFLEVVFSDIKTQKKTRTLP